MVERLTPEQWDHAVRAALETRDKWIPSAGELLHLGWELRPVAAGLLPADVDTRTPEQRKADAIETSRRLREIVQQATGDDVRPRDWPAERKHEPKADTFDVKASEERMRMLREQAERLKAEAITEPEAVKS